LESLSAVPQARPVVRTDGESHWFHSDPEQAWGFYGHRRNLYRATEPHRGFAVLRRWAERMPAGHFVFTSNVDNHFQRAGFADETILECHGSIEHLQCQRFCGGQIWPADSAAVNVDESTFRAREPLPRCRLCDGIARPNVLMFGDGGWLEQRTAEQMRRYRAWLKQVAGKRRVIVECGAGTAVPTVRWECERIGATLIRINVREPEVPSGGIGIPLGARLAIERLDAFLFGAA